MREMKDSGYKWLKEIPKDWKLVRIKNLIGNVYNIKKKFREVDILSLGINGVTVKEDLTFGMNPTNYDDHNIVKKGQYVICLRDLDGPLLCGISKYDGCLSALYYIFDFNKQVSKNFFNYIMKTSDYTRFIDAFSYGMRHSYNFLQFGNLKIPFTNINEQNLIANFLDKKCSKIDEISKDLQDEIDTLENYKKSVITEAVTKGLNPNVDMKDSKIRYIGKMPQHWTTDKGKFIFRYVQKPVKQDDGVITCFRDGEVTLRSKRREDGFTISEKEIGYQGIDKGDLIIHGMDGFAGAIGISDSRGKASPVLNVLETKNSKRFYMYYLRSMALRGVFEALSTGIRVRTCDTNWGKLKEIVYLLPPIPEQKEIANYLDAKCSEIDEIIKNKKDQLETIEEYKKSLIYEYVTGKKEVKNA